jgi:hypothetical protein
VSTKIMAIYYTDISRNTIAIGNNKIIDSKFSVYSGVIDEMILFYRALSSTEIIEIYFNNICHYTCSVCTGPLRNQC